MIALRVDLAKRSFFDRQAVLKATNAAERRVLSRAGAFIRRRARSSIKNAPNVNVRTGLILRGRKRKGMKYRQAVSRPGQPPYSHNQLLRRFILFSYESQRRSVIVGPAKLNRPGNAPEVLEKGGSALIKVGRKRKRVFIAARPYMGPALLHELPKVRQLWRDSVK